jgi:hypothetical protein
MNITTDNFTKKLKEFAGTQTKMRKQAHALACFSINHTSAHGDPSYVQAFADTLTKGQAASFKRYIVKVCAQVEGDANTSFITLKKGKFVTNTDVETRNMYVTIEGEREVVDTAERLHEGPSFLDIDPDKEKNPFDTLALVKAINSLVKRAEKDEAEVDTHVMDALQAAAENITNAAGRAAELQAAA